MTRGSRAALAAHNQQLRCSISGCTSLRHGTSRHCNRHHLREQRYGDPNFRGIVKRQLTSYRKLAKRFLKVNHDHPAVVLVCAELDRLMSDGVEYVNVHVNAETDPHWKPSPRDIRGKQAVEMRRLRERGATALDLLAAALSVELFAFYRSNVLERATPAYNYTLARAVLMVKPLEAQKVLRADFSTRAVSPYLSTCMLRELGKHLAVSLCGVLDAATKAIDKQLREPPPTRSQRIAKAITVPFKAPRRTRPAPLPTEITVPT
jgi:hypothetical protein